MKLKQLRLESFKCFRHPLQLDGLSTGINLFVAPNEAGKSTVAEAIRAAFFERHRSSTLDTLRPWGDGSATPLVELEFELQGKNAQLSKAFMGKKRCHLRIDGLDLDGNAAEDHLAALLGFRFASKGASSAEHLGIPGLLWIRQGESHEIAAAVRHAEDHLRQALGNSLGELTASHGDAVLKAVESQRKELLTPSTGAPRGAYLEASKRRSALEAELQLLWTDIQAYRDSVDHLASLRRVHAQEASEQPWLKLREQWAQARQRLDEAQGLNEKKSAHDRLLNQIHAQVQALRGQLQAMAAERDALGLREDKLRTAQQRLTEAQTLLQAWQPRQQQAELAYAVARKQLQQARQAHAREAQNRTVAELRARLATLQQSHDKATVEQDQLSQLQAQAQALALPPGQLKRLRACAEALSSAQSRLDAAATTLEFELSPCAVVRLAGTPLTGSQRQTVVRRTDIEIEGVGRIRVLPGGLDLDQLAHDRDRHQAELSAALQALGLSSLAAAEERERLQLQRSNEAKAAEAVLAAHAPKGLNALSTELAALRSRLTEAEQTLATMTDSSASAQPPFPAAPPHPQTDAAASSPPTLAAQSAQDGLDTQATAPSIAQTEADEENCRLQLEATNQALSAAQAGVGNAHASVQAAEEELAAVQSTLNTPGRAQKESAAQMALTDALAQLHMAQNQAAEIADQLQSANLPVLQQDVERYERSAKHSETLHAERTQAITRLEAELETKGALGLEESAAQLQHELEQTTRRCNELARHARALDHLYQLLNRKRTALAQQLRAPLQQHLNHYLQILFPGAHIEVDDQLGPGVLTRHGHSSHESGDFESHSVGAREQLGIIARLAYADLLREAGKPTLLILDDALVHTDSQRLGQMKRVLYDAASRHQILIFSCHPQAWLDLGVIARRLGD